MKGVPGRINQTFKNKRSEGDCQGQGTEKTKPKNPRKTKLCHMQGRRALKES